MRQTHSRGIKSPTVDCLRITCITNRTKPLQPVTLSFDEILEYEAAFRAVDADGDGTIDVKELGEWFIFMEKLYLIAGE